MRNRTFTKLAVIGVASAMLVPVGASAQPMDGQAIAAGGGSGVTAQGLRPSTAGSGVTGEDYSALNQAPNGLKATQQDLRAPDQANGGLKATQQDLRAPDQITPAGPGQPASAPTLSAAPHWPAHPQALEPRVAAASSSKSNDTIDSAWLIGLGGLAVGCLAGLGLVYRIRVRNARQSATA